MNRGELRELLEQQFEKKIAVLIKQLLEEKHLYQSIEVNLDEFKKSMNRLNSDQKRHETSIWDHFNSLVLKEWLFRDPGSLGKPLLSANNNYSYYKEKLTIELPTVKLYCENCEKKEAFNILSCKNFFDVELSSKQIYRNKKNQLIQTIVFSYLCQYCKLIPEVFLIRRVGLKLILAGRSPMEALELPKYIPTEIKKYYSDAVLAYNSGQILPALFMLRTLIEQWALNSNSDKSLLADQLLDDYMKSLPQDFKNRFPSMRVLYGDLSADIHKAAGSEELFNRAKIEIDQHFEARKLFKLSSLPNNEIHQTGEK